MGSGSSSSTPRYSSADIARMREEIRNLRSILAHETNSQRRQSIQNQIRGLENSISGRYN